MKCRNCDSDTSLGFRRLCITHAHEAGQELLETMLAFVLDHDNGLEPSVDRLRAAIANAEGSHE